jgi:hypothetical protein
LEIKFQGEDWLPKMYPGFSGVSARAGPKNWCTCGFEGYQVSSIPRNGKSKPAWQGSFKYHER